MTSRQRQRMQDRIKSREKRYYDVFTDIFLGRNQKLDDIERRLLDGSVSLFISEQNSLQ